jgi:predicted 3-demethylubiquinone-9 3-methyltransferase (glyoxalase superfamily)
MTNEIYPRLWFDGQAKEAASFLLAQFSINQK